MKVILNSFGYKYGNIPKQHAIPYDNKTFVMDVRAFKNPYHIPELTGMTGKDEPVQEFLSTCIKVKIFIEERVFGIQLLFKGNPNRTITYHFGCTGGQHRSVAIVELLAQKLRKIGTFDIEIHHRELDKDVKHE